MQFHLRMFSCSRRDAVRAQTLESWRKTDWCADMPVEMDVSVKLHPFRRIEETWLRALRVSVASATDFILLLEDDLEFNHFLRHNLEQWPPLRAITDSSLPFFGTLYRSSQPILWQNEYHRYALVAPESFWGSQALVMSRGTALHLLEHWTEGEPPDLKAPRLAAQLCPLYCHVPSLVQHRIGASTWGSGIHQSTDFDADYRAP